MFLTLSKIKLVTGFGVRDGKCCKTTNLLAWPEGNLVEITNGDKGEVEAMVRVWNGNLASVVLGGS
jgi:hypothetical protein